MPHECTDCSRVFADGSKEMLSGCPDCGGTTFQFHPDEEAAASSDGEPAPEPPEPPDRPGGTVARTVGKTAATVRDLVGGSGPAEPDSTPAPSPGGDDGAVGGTANADDGVAGSAPAAGHAAEDDAQASARSGLVAPDELPTEREDGDREHRFDPTPAREAQQRARDDEASGDQTADAEHDGDAADGQSTPPTMAAGAAPTNGSADANGDGQDPADRPDLSELRAELNDQFESIKVLQPGQYELNLMELYDREEYIIALQEDGKYSIQVPEAIRAAGDD